MEEWIKPSQRRGAKPEAEAMKAAIAGKLKTAALETYFYGSLKLDSP